MNYNIDLHKYNHAQYNLKCYNNSYQCRKLKRLVITVVCFFKGIICHKCHHFFECFECTVHFSCHAVSDCKSFQYFLSDQNCLLVEMCTSSYLCFVDSWPTPTKLLDNRLVNTNKIRVTHSAKLSCLNSRWKVYEVRKSIDFSIRVDMTRLLPKVDPLVIFNVKRAS